MLKIKKTKPYQFRKLYNNSVTYNNLSNKSKLYISRVLCSLTLICGIVPSLALLTYYNPYSEKVSAASMSINNISTMQEMRSGICHNMKIGDSATLTDTRDNNTYTIAKLSDGKCWMTQNLRLINKTITSADSNVSANFTVPASALWTDTSYTAPHAYYNNDTDYGAYYNWYTATAGTGTNSVPSGDASSSICPKGWRLPTGGSSGEFQALYAKYPNSNSSTGWVAAASGPNGKAGRWIGASTTTGGAFFPAAGYMYTDNGSLSSVGSYGYYWSSTANDANSAYRLLFNSSYINPAANYNKYSGYSVRCVADSYAEADTDIIAIVVPPVISIDATSGMNKEVDPNLVTKGEISATISANTTYSVQLSANKTSLTNSQTSDEPTPTNSIPASSNVTPKTNAWGILNQDNSTYSAITTAPTEYYNTEEYNTESQSTKHTFGIGVSISPTLPAGEYSTTVTITAVNN